MTSSIVPFIIVTLIVSIITFHQAPTVSAFNLKIINRATTTSTSKQKNNLLPTVDPTNPTRFLPPASFTTTSTTNTKTFRSQFYPPLNTLYAAGPLPFITRLTQTDRYEQTILKYLYETQTSDLIDAQANADFYFAAPDVWAEQKLLEKQGKREVFDYGKCVTGMGVEKVVLRSIWAVGVTGLGGRVVWQLIHGNRNLF